MGRRDKERKEGVAAGTILPTAHLLLLKRLRGDIKDAQETFGHNLTNRLLLFAMDRPEEGK